MSTSRPFSEDEYALLSRHFRDSNNTRDRLLLVLGCGTGFRVHELLSLTRAQVWDGADVTREVTVERRDLKGGRGARRRSIRSRRMPLSEPVRAAIREHLASIDPEGTFLFETSRSAGKGMNRSQAYRVLVKACVACGIDPARISTHSLRKTFVTRIYEASGHDLIRTQRIVGHTSPITTARYLETSTDDLDRLVLTAAA